MNRVPYTTPRTITEVTVDNVDFRFIPTAKIREVNPDAPKWRVMIFYPLVQLPLEWAMRVGLIQPVDPQAPWPAVRAHEVFHAIFHQEDYEFLSGLYMVVFPPIMERMERITSPDRFVMTLGDPAFKSFLSVHSPSEVMQTLSCQMCGKGKPKSKCSQCDQSLCSKVCFSKHLQQCNI